MAQVIVSINFDVPPDDTADVGEEMATWFEFMSNQFRGHGYLPPTHPHYGRFGDAKQENIYGFWAYVP